MIGGPVPHCSFDTQRARLGNGLFSVARLAKLAEDLPVMDIPLAHLNTYFQSPSMTLREMAGHMRAAMDADMDCPIILDEDGEIMDGRHRIMRAIFEERETIKAVRFETNPSPCEIIKD